MYQLDFDYRFDSSKIESAFGLQATPYREGIRATLDWQPGSWVAHRPTKAAKLRERHSGPHEGYIARPALEHRHHQLH